MKVTHINAEFTKFSQVYVVSLRLNMSYFCIHTLNKIVNGIYFRDESLAALHEAIRMAQETNDHECLQHALVSASNC